MGKVVSRELQKMREIVKVIIVKDLTSLVISETQKILLLTQYFYLLSP